MFSGIFLAVLTNLCWTVFGAVLSFTARGQGRLPALFALIFAGGFLNSLAQFVTNRAMKQGHNSIIWAACTMKYRLNDRQIYRRN